MHHVFGPVLDEFVTVYLDDILVFSRTEAEHERHLRDTFDRLRAHGLKAKRKKCNFGVFEVEYLGHWVRGGERHMDAGKVRDILAWPEPANVKQVQQFMGLANYYSQYVRHFARLAAPITDLILSTVAFSWGP